MLRLIEVILSPTWQLDTEAHLYLNLVIQNIIDSPSIDRVLSEYNKWDMDTQSYKAHYFNRLYIRHFILGNRGQVYVDGVEIYPVFKFKPVPKKIPSNVRKSDKWTHYQLSRC